MSGIEILKAEIVHVSDVIEDLIQSRQRHLAAARKEDATIDHLRNRLAALKRDERTLEMAAQVEALEQASREPV